MATLQEPGRIALAIAVASQPIHLAWGRGSPAWDEAPQPEGKTNTALVDEIGRRASTQVGYCKPDEDGEIELPSGRRFSLSAEPTPFVFVRFVFAFAEAAGEIIREQGIFLGTQVKAGLPAGQRYFLPSELANTGRLYSIERVPAFIRDGSTRHYFELVLPF